MLSARDTFRYKNKDSFKNYEKIHTGNIKHKKVNKAVLASDEVDDKTQYKIQRGLLHSGKQAVHQEDVTINTHIPKNRALQFTKQQLAQ